MKLDFSKKVWPKNIDEMDGINVQSRHLQDKNKYRHEGFVHEGLSVAIPLCFPGQSVPLAADESYIQSLCLDHREVLYLGCGGKRAHLLVGMIQGPTGIIYDLATLQENANVSAVMIGPDQQIFAVTNHCEEGALYRHIPEPLLYDCIQEWLTASVPAEKLSVPVKGEGIAAALMSPDHQSIYGLSEKSGTFFRYDIHRNKTHSIRIVCDIRRFSKTMVLGSDQKIYGTSANGTLWYFDIKSEEFREMDIRIPSVAGRQFHNAVDSFAVDYKANIIYGGGTADGVLFAFYPETGQMKSLGKATAFAGVPALCVLPDSRVIGISGANGDIAHIFEYDPFNHELKDLGMPVSTLCARVYGYEFRGGVCNKNGHVYLGQHERGGHLWIYFPAVRTNH